MKFHLSSRAALIIIAAMFILPLVLAWLMQSGAIEFKPGSARNLGDLVQPPVPADWQDSLNFIPAVNDAPREEISVLFDRHWVILHVIPSPCPSPCLEAISALRQIHKASGRNQSRIRIALLLQSGDQAETISSVGEIYHLFRLVENPSGNIRSILEDVAHNFSTGAEGSSYLIDPIGNIMMFYEAGSDPNNLKNDLKRLLTWSKLDK
jgi:hypothetical protein